MARMIPTQFDGKSPAERKIFNALKNQLDDGYTVFHSVEWLRKDRGHTVLGESDFVILSRDLGIMAVECKGGRITHDPASGQWFSTDREDIRHPIRDPVRQARDSMYAMKAVLDAARVTQGFETCLSYAVCFPDMHRQHVPAMPALPREILLSLEDLEDIRPALLRVSKYHLSSGQVRFPSAEEMDRAVSAIAPRFALAAPLAHLLDLERTELIRLTEQQYTLLSALKMIPRARIQGCAGSGKTLLAVEKARQLARDGARTLFLCFNLFLADHVKRLLSSSSDSIDVYSFESFAMSMAGKAGLPWNKPTDDAAVPLFFDQEVPQLLKDALSRLGPPYDAIVIDEGQDFLTGYYDALHGALLTGERGTLYVFTDPGQDIFNHRPNYPADLQGPFLLTHNCRNTASIAALLEHLTDTPVPVHQDAPIGDQPRFFPCTGRAEQLAVVKQLVHDLCEEGKVPPDQVVILSCRSARRSAVGSEERIGRFEVARDVFPHPPGKLLVTSLLRFKGLEADVVILTDIDPSLPQASDVHLYVAASRARHRLFLLGASESIERLRHLTAQARDRR